MNTVALLIKSTITQKIAFRKKIAAKYDDQRNHVAIELCERLVNEPDVSTDVLNGFSEFELRRATNDVCHKIGFRAFPSRLSDLVALIADKAREHRFEIDAVWGKR
jgi:hypothetical protein